LRARNDPVGYSPALFVDFTSPPPYASGCCTDPDSGEWKGPPYAAEQKPDLGGTATIDWSATFDREPRTAIDAIRAHLVHHWPAEAFKPTAVPHVVKTGRGARRVGTIPAEIGITHEPGSNAAQVEAAVAFPLCKGIFVVARFDLLEPGADDTNGVFGRYLIKGAVPSAWNRAAAIAAIQGVSVEGLLPARTIKLGGSLKAAGSPSVPATVIGSVLDCRGHVMPGVRVPRCSSTALKTAFGTSARVRSLVHGKCGASSCRSSVPPCLHWLGMMYVGASANSDGFCLSCSAISVRAVAEGRPRCSPTATPDW
jgi:hypothetical protein